MTAMTLPCRIVLTVAALLAAVATDAAEAGAIGWRTTTVPAIAERPAIPVALWYPAEEGAVTRVTPMGPFTVRAAIGASAAPAVRGLILLSHGTGGSELAQGRIAEALAARGYLVAAPRHPGDNWQDDSLRTKTAERYFDERPRQARRVIDALLADPAWRDRIARDPSGPLVGAVGHSAGGYTVLALAGAQPVPGRIAAHCAEHARNDRIFCSLPTGRSAAADAPREAAAEPGADLRVRAVAALAPVGAVFDAASLRSVRIPVAVWIAELDRYLVPRFHGDWIAQQLPDPFVRRVLNAWHFAFVDTPANEIASPDGDLRDDPPGFDRARFLDQLGEELGAFVDKALRGR